MLFKSKDLVGTVLAALSVFSSVAAQGSASTAEFESLAKARIPFIVQTYPVLGGDQQLAGILQNQTAEGDWPVEVNYTSGCDAQRANWPAQGHWLRTLPLAAAYTDNIPHSVNITQEPPYDFKGREDVKVALDKAMNWWFTRDFTDPACLTQGGLSNNTCPCGTAGLWNTNWYSNLILVARQAGQTCILLRDTITPEQRSKCIEMGQRGYDMFGKFIYGLGYLTGANTLDVSSNEINVGILTGLAGNVTGGTALIDAAYARIHDEVVIQTTVKADGIRPDGSFGQHLGILYNGNYGKDYTNLVLALEISAAGTRWEANSTSQNAFAMHMDGSTWMVYRNLKTNVLHWDVSTIGRFISFPVVDKQATGGLNINVTSVQQLGQRWESKQMTDAASRWLATDSTANSGGLVGNRMFWDNDYMVHRGSNYVTTVKMISPRSSNTECVNNQNPLGFHLGQGNVFTYVSGNEYEDTAAAWDWNLIPGITTDYSKTTLNCNFTQWSGNRTFVGGASDGKVGVAAMDYLNPYSGAFMYKKAWFFFDDDVQHVLVPERSIKVAPGRTLGGVSSETGAALDIRSVLEQKRSDGVVYVDGKEVAGGLGLNVHPSSLWHGGVGYTFDSNPASPALSFSVADRTGNWTTIGTSSVKTPVTVNFFTAYFTHNSAKPQPLAYSVYPGTTTSAAFDEKVKTKRIITVKNDFEVSAAIDSGHKTAMAVFWRKGSVDFPWTNTHVKRGIHVGVGVGQKVTVESSAPAVVIFRTGGKGSVVVSDPTQTLKKVTIKITAQGRGNGLPSCLSSGRWKSIVVDLPQGATVGKSVAKPVC